MNNCMAYFNMIFEEFFRFMEDVGEFVIKIITGGDDDDHWNGGFKVAVQ